MINFASNEVARVSCLTAHDLVGTATEPEFDEIARLAADLLDAPAGLVTIVGLDETWVRGSAGLDAVSAPRSDSICSYTILQDDVLVISDLTKDPRFTHIRAIVGEHPVRFYAGAPIVTADGLSLGAVCILDTAPRDGLTPEQQAALQRLARIAGSAFDERRQRADMEDRSKSLETTVTRTLELSNIVLWQADRQGRLLSLDLCARPVDAARRRLREISWINDVHPDDVEEVTRSWRAAVMVANTFSAEFRLRTKTGAWRWFRCRAARDCSPTGGSDWFGTRENIDRQRQDAARIAELEAELNHVSRLSAMGTMASTLAHELNQPLTAAANYARTGARMAAGGDASSADLVEMMTSAAEAVARAGGIVRSMRELVSRGDLQRRSADVQSLVREAYRIAIIDLSIKSLDTRFSFDPNMTKLMVDPIQIQQVIINLVRNAIQAMGGAEVGRVRIAVRKLPNDQCEISVADSGPGIDAAIAKRLFTPFNSSKRDGMGIGLSISRTIVEAHGGQIAAEQGAEGGTVFRVTIPIVE